ncbi:hypothetical protein [Modestobacter sp. NPDC049651]|uniref:hypothetical protein n=1 Tax=unclassified Modestobacter TaxID=2643866 RepID=UPI0033FE53FF
MSPFRWPVVITGFVLALPVLALGLRGDLTTEDVLTRVLWCLGAGWFAVALVQWASTPPRTPSRATPAGPAAAEPEVEPAAEPPPFP